MNIRFVYATNMATAWTKPCKAAWTFFLLMVAVFAVWKEIKLDREVCQGRPSTARLLNAKPVTVSEDATLVRRPVRESPSVMTRGTLSKNYMLMADHFQRDYNQIENANIILFATSPPSSGIVNLIELFYALHIAPNCTVSPLVDNTIISSGNSSKIRDYVWNAIRVAQPPALVHTHAYHVDLPLSIGNTSSKASESILQISIVRDPVERAVSLYNYARANNTQRDSELIRKWRQSLKIRRWESYDDCVRLRRTECVSEASGMRLVRHFCGYESRCQRKTQWALERAKYNIAKYYYVIGIREEFEIFIQVLNRRLPSIFSESSRLYYDLLDKGKVTRQDRYSRTMPSRNTIEKMKKMMALDIELYEWIKARFIDAQKRVGLKI